MHGHDYDLDIISKPRSGKEDLSIVESDTSESSVSCYRASPAEFPGHHLPMWTWSIYGNIGLRRSRSECHNTSQHLVNGQIWDERSRIVLCRCHLHSDRLPAFALARIGSVRSLLYMLAHIQTYPSWMDSGGRWRLSWCLLFPWWTARDAMVMTYPLPKYKGKHVSLNLTVFNLGAVLASLVSTISALLVSTANRLSVYLVPKLAFKIDQRQRQDLHWFHLSHVCRNTSFNAHRSVRDCHTKRWISCQPTRFSGLDRCC